MDCSLEYTNFKDYLIEYKCLCCNKNYQRNFDKKLKERCFNIYKFSIHDNNNFILLLQKGFYPYEYMDDNSMKHRYLKEKIFIVNDADYAHEKRVCKDFEIKN